MVLCGGRERMENTRRTVVLTIAALTVLLSPACGSEAPPTSPSGDPPSANVYILPGAADLGPNAFGDHPIVIYKGERMRLRNIDTVQHDVVPDSASLPEFSPTDILAPGSERSFVMTTLGQTTFHCTIHPQMVGTLIVAER